MISSEMDFTLSAYKQLISTLQAQSFIFQTFEGFIQNPKEKVLILRHDVDRLPGNSLKTARMENETGVKASYYFRIVKESYDEDIIKQIAEMGHEIAYHYEDLSLCNGNFELAILNFELNLEKLRKIYPVKTICMHGSPLSRYDNRLLWEKYDYRDFDIIGEPYFDIDFSEVFYLSDTGRSWNNSKVSVRDKVRCQVPGAGCRELGIRGQRLKVRDQKNECEGQKSWVQKNRWPNFRSTFDIIEAAEKGLLPDKIMLNVHPQRWTNDFVPRVKEFVFQNFKNIIKRQLVKLRD